MGKICPYCKTELEESDEIAVCSFCNMPLQKKCRIENKEYKSFGSEENRNENLQNHFDKTKGLTYCAKCGNPNEVLNLYCVKCGNKLNATQRIAEQYIYKNAENHFGIETKYIQVNNYYYRKVFEKMNYDRNKKIVWNWGAFAFGGYWFLYRKMYLQGFAAIGIAWLWYIVGDVMAYAFSFALCIVLGMYANYIYKRHIEKLMAEGNLLNELEEERFAKRKGGTSFIGVVLTLVVVFLVSYCCYYYMGY